MKTIEQRTAETILEQPIETVEIGGKNYEIAPPTLATLIEVSKLVSLMPPVSEQADNILSEVLLHAKDTHVLGRIVATLILGVTKEKKQKNELKSGLFGWLKKRKQKSVIEQLAEDVINTQSVGAIRELITRGLSTLQVGDFFGLTTSLSVANMTRATREVVTVFGE